MNADIQTSLRFDFATAHRCGGLAELDAAFLQALQDSDHVLRARLLSYRAGEQTFTALDVSELLLALAPLLETFIVGYFDIESEVSQLCVQTLYEKNVGRFKHEFVAQRARRYKGELDDFAQLDQWLSKKIGSNDDREGLIAHYAVSLLGDEEAHAEAIERLSAWCKLAQTDPAGQRQVENWNSFRLPQSVDFAHLVTFQAVEGDISGRLQTDPEDFRQRDGFTLTDPRMPRRDVMAEIEYCVYCHDRDGDFCSKGFPENKKKPELGLKKNALAVTLTGCPLDEKISEMHVLKRDGRSIAALAMAMVDNPMVPATGHRICNDCMKGCIYQKKDPVNIPQIETRVLTDVLDLPWGVEIYHLLARWNPLRQRQYLARPYNGRNVLISGMGPAGFTMAHHLTMEGCAVVGIDGLKIEPLPAQLLDNPVRDYQDLVESLDDRILAGFGGVAEYGITVRWDKNFLKLIYLTLARREHFQVFGGCRLGGTLEIGDAWELGFDHVCFANGAGLPRVIGMGQSLARGMRQANDFLMALQLTGAAKLSSLANLQVRMPAVVIGGGLTAIDTATEVQTYYIKQVEKILWRYEQLVAAHDEEHVLKGLDEEHRGILDEFLQHGRAVRAERERAAQKSTEPDFIALLRGWGGVTIVYRRGANESPAYLRNHEEIIKAMEEGIYYAPGLSPVRAELDEYGHVRELVCHPRKIEQGRWVSAGKDRHLPARAILVAAGTLPNTIYEGEHNGTFKIEDNHFMTHVAHTSGMQPVGVAEHCKAHEIGPFTSYSEDSHRVSFLGDAHPVFNGSVVKAIASAQKSYPDIITALGHLKASEKDTHQLAEFQAHIDDVLTPTVAEVKTDHPAVIELLIRAPMAAKNFKAGQFFRLQTFESHSPIVENTRLQLPLQTISGAGVDGDRIRLFLLRWGANAQLAARLKPGDPLVLMGPTGAPTPLVDGKTVMVVAGSWGAAVMLGLGPALRARGMRLLYFAAYDSKQELYCKKELEASAECIVWATAQGEAISADRPQDISVQTHDMIDLIHRYRRGELHSEPGAPTIVLSEVDEIMIMGSTGLLRGFQTALQGELKEYFPEEVQVTGSVGSPMQCMLKGVCGQCLQWQIDPDSGERTRAVFSCAEQDQPLMWIDLDNLAARQAQNRLGEHLTNLWVQHVLDRNTAAA